MPLRLSLPWVRRAEASAAAQAAEPQVSVILTTRNRPRLVRIALACYQHQTYPNRELIVVDDGEAYPVDEAAVTAVGGRLIRVEPGTPLGTKLNRGANVAQGVFCQKMDDDDWYAPDFMQTMVGAVLKSWSTVCRPTLAFLRGFRFFDVARWEVRLSTPNNAPGATLLFDRELWQERPFRALFQDEDVWLFLDQLSYGVTLLPVIAPQIFLAVRHRGGTVDRSHTWTQQYDGRAMEEYLLDRQLFEGGPEAILPEWALETYRELRRDILASAPPVGAAERPGAGQT
jgi:glycosyltransferase involved in cell wall biosynthesis